MVHFSVKLLLLLMASVAATLLLHSGGDQGDWTEFVLIAAFSVALLWTIGQLRSDQQRHDELKNQLREGNE